MKNFNPENISITLKKVSKTLIKDQERRESET